MFTRSVTRSGIVVSMWLAAVLGGCTRSATPGSATASETESTAKAEVSSDAMPSADVLTSFQAKATEEALPPGHPPLGQPAAAAKPSAQPQAALPDGHPPLTPAADPSLAFDTPPDWKPQTSRSRMRQAQFTLPRAAGDDADGELIVYFFPGGAGDAESNINRWRGMFTTSDGAPIGDEAVVRSQFTAGDLHVTMIDIAGRYSPAQMPGVTASAGGDQYRMYAAVVEGGGQQWYVKATGPARTMTEQRETFMAFMRSLRIKAGG